MTRVSAVAVGIGAVLVCAVYAASSTGAAVPFPAGYRTWTHVKSTLVGPTSQGFARNGGLHHFYANAKAVEGYASGKFPDGSVIVDERLQAEESDGVTKEGARQSVSLMMKDGQRYRETGGWGFETFRGDNQADGASPDVRNACFECHSKAKDRDFVFSKIRP